MHVFAMLFAASAPAMAFGDDLAALSRRTGIDAKELRAILGECQRDQRRADICALQDLIIAEARMQVASKKAMATATPACRKRATAAQAFWLATAGGAEALYLDERIGRIAEGYEADLCVLDLKATPMLAFRTGFCDSIEDQLFALMTLGDDRTIRATYVAGHLAYDRDRLEPFRQVDGQHA